MENILLQGFDVAEAFFNMLIGLDSFLKQAHWVGWTFCMLHTQIVLLRSYMVCCGLILVRYPDVQSESRKIRQIHNLSL